MGLFDRSSSSNTNNLLTQTETVTNQSDQSGNAGLNFSQIAGGVGLEFNTRSTENLSAVDSHNITDSRRSVETNSTVINSTDQGAVGAGRELGLAGIKASTDSLSAVQSLNANSLSILAGLANNSIDASKTIARDGATKDAQFLQSALSGFNSLSMQNSQSSDDRIVKLVGMALLAIALVVIGPALFKGGGKAVLA